MYCEIDRVSNVLGGVKMASQRIDRGDILSIEGLNKSFPGVQALDDVSFNIKGGTIHALVGENGAGKSTLIKILAGIYRADSGKLMLRGEPIAFKTPHEAQMMGISVVHQEIKLAETLSVAENIFLGNLLYTRLGLVDWRGMRRRAQKMIDSLGIDIDVDVSVENLTVAQRQIVEICKAINLECEILIMDEPSATLTNRESEILFKIVNRLRAQGLTIIYISHRLEEIFRLADNVTVLRDGKHIDTLPVSRVNRGKLIEMMVGRVLEDEYPKGAIQIGEPILEVRGLSRKGVLDDISFKVHRGEVLGFSGLVGAGRTELARAILGIDPIDSGEILLRGEPIHNRSFRHAIDLGFGLVSEDRQQQGIVEIFSVRENICMVSIDKILHRGFISRRLERRYAEEYVGRLNIVTPSIDTEVQYLSGGNQQKVVIAKWLMKDSEIIFLDEPTRGIDVGAKAEIYMLINELVKAGKTIIMISSEMPEVIGMSDRIIVMHEGRIVGELSREEATQEKIMSLCL